MKVLSKSLNNQYLIVQLDENERTQVGVPFAALDTSKGETQTLDNICNKGSSVQEVEKFVANKMKSFKYSIMALRHLKYLDHKEPQIKHTTISWGNTQLMEELFILFGGDRNELRERTKCIGHHYRFKFVMDKLDRESKRENAIFEKGFIHYNGIINRPTRCFSLKDDIKTSDV